MNPFVAHLIGDFILQNEWMAVNKKKSSFACLVHALSYLIPFLFSNLLLWQILLIGIQHFIQDRTQFIYWWVHRWKRIKLGKENGIALFVDQAFHIVWIEFVIKINEGSLTFFTF
jgi:hypothetical protein